jgi:hypothetical protein
MFQARKGASAVFHSKFDKSTDRQPFRHQGRSTFEALRNGPQPALAGDFARAAYYGALSISDLLAVIANPDPYLLVLTDMYIHAIHDVPYTLADAQEVSRLDEHDALIVVTRLIRHNMARRLGKLQDGVAFEPYDRNDLAPMQKAELAGFFARAFERGPAILEEWMRTR